MLCDWREIHIFKKQEQGKRSCPWGAGVCNLAQLRNLKEKLSEMFMGALKILILKGLSTDHCVNGGLIVKP